MNRPYRCMAEEKDLFCKILHQTDESHRKGLLVGCACGGRASSGTSRNTFESFRIALGKKAYSYSQSAESAHDTYELFVEHDPVNAADVRLDRVNPVSNTVLEALRPTSEEKARLRQGWRPTAKEMRQARTQT